MNESAERRARGKRFFGWHRHQDIVGCYYTVRGRRIVLKERDNDENNDTSQGSQKRQNTNHPASPTNVSSPIVSPENVIVHCAVCPISRCFDVRSHVHAREGIESIIQHVKLVENARIEGVLRTEKVVAALALPAKDVGIVGEHGRIKVEDGKCTVLELLEIEWLQIKRVQLLDTGRDEQLVLGRPSKTGARAQHAPSSRRDSCAFCV